MKSYIKQRALTVSIVAVLSMSLFAQTEGKKVKIFLSSINGNEMLVEQQEIIFKQDFVTENLLINIYPEFQYQKVLGFGAAFTETSAVNFSLLRPTYSKSLPNCILAKAA